MTTLTVDELNAEIEAREQCGIVQPKWAVGWTKDELIALADREGLNPYDKDWGDSLDSLYRTSKLDTDRSKPFADIKTLNSLRQQRIALRNQEQSERPATKKQTWALFCLTRKDYRDQGLTVEEASQLIEQAIADKGKRSNGNGKKRTQAASK